MAAVSTHTGHPLLDLPDELLERCIPHGDRQTWATCKRLAHKNAVRLRLQLQMSQDGDVVGQRTTLLRMMKALPALRKLDIHFVKAWDSKALDDLVTAPDPTQPAWLNQVTDLSIRASAAEQGTTRSFVSPCVAKACPHLAKLELVTASITDPEHLTLDQPLVILQGLKELVLNHCNVDMKPDTLERQFEALPHLQELKLITCDAKPIVLLSSRLTDLVLVDDYTHWDRLTQNCVKGQWPVLRKFSSEGLSLTAQQVQSLTTMMPEL